MNVAYVLPRRGLLPVDQYMTPLVKFTREMLASKDIDPMYDMLSNITDDQLAIGGDEEQVLWLLVLYVAFYHLPSAIRAFRVAPRMPVWEQAARLKFARRDEWAGLPTGIERRGNRGGAVVDHLLSYIREVAPYQTQKLWITQRWAADPVENYERFWATWQTVHNNGRWSAFKMAEILKEVAFYKLAAPDMRMEFCSGPKEGLAWLYSLPDGATVGHLNAAGDDLRERLVAAGIPLSWERLETILCNFNSLRKGRYYVGHDIDEMHEQIEHARASGLLSVNDYAMLLDARAKVLPRHYRGESRHHRKGWGGIQKDRMTAFRDKGVVLTRPVLG